MKKSILSLLCSGALLAGFAQAPQLTIKASKGLPFLSSHEGRSYQSIQISLENAGDSAAVSVQIKGAPDLVAGVGHGNRDIEALAPEVKKATMVGYTVRSGSVVVGTGK